LKDVTDIESDSYDYDDSDSDDDSDNIVVKDIINYNDLSTLNDNDVYKISF